jgi:hypothetical protein
VQLQDLIAQPHRAVAADFAFEGCLRAFPEWQLPTVRQSCELIASKRLRTCRGDSVSHGFLGFMVVEVPPG